MYYTLFLFFSSYSHWSIQPTQKPGKRKARWRPNTCYKYEWESHFPLTVLNSHFSSGSFLSWIIPHYFQSWENNWRGKRRSTTVIRLWSRVSSVLAHVGFCYKKGKKYIWMCFFVVVLQSQLNQTEAQCSSVEQELKGDCSLLPTMSQTFVSIVGI